jgi:hypothetical protein
VKIIVKSNGGPNFWLPIPSGLILNRFAAGFAPKYLKEYGLNITKEQAVTFVKELNRYRRKHPEWVLVEVQSSSGEYVKIKL